ncbi:MAG TPA: nucleotidyltransferase family protein [Anaerolineales bacterium]|nr:nucleotidyltransferase family protein [Anaerolineales bacterium]HNN13792.1 nucleotidyltransferase family protein [Anaerolineales bacterium]
METSLDLVQEMYRLVEAANAKKINLRAIGGLAVQTHNKMKHPLFTREFADLDFCIPLKQRREFEAFMPEMGYSPHRQFNVLNGDQRQIYYHNPTEMKVDIFVGNFEMCHKIPLEDRLGADPVTIPLAELMLSKAQIIELNRKDAFDLTSLLLNNATGNNDIETINLMTLAQLCSQDWGLYKTTSLNLDKVETMLNKGEIPLNEEESGIVIQHINEIRRAFAEMPKPLAWQLRDRVGTRVKWYIEVEEVQR